MKLRPGPSTHLSPVTSSSSLRCHQEHQEQQQQRGRLRIIDPSKARSLVIVPLLMLGVLYFTLPAVCAFDQGSIRFENNGYTGITVSFSPDIQYSQRETLLLELQVSVQILTQLHTHTHWADYTCSFSLFLLFLLPSANCIIQQEAGQQNRKEMSPCQVKPHSLSLVRLTTRTLLT